MNNKDLWEYIFAANKKLFLLIGEIMAALISLESFALLKRPNVAKWRMFLAKSVITIFITLLIWPLINEYMPKYAYIIIGIIALICIPVLEWFLNKLVPGILQASTGIIIALMKGFIKKNTGIDTDSSTDIKKGDESND